MTHEVLTLEEFDVMFQDWREREGLPPLKRHLPHCGAHCRDGHPCQARATRDEQGFVFNGRCRLHGGLSTGPKTEAGRRRIAQAAQKRWREYRAATAQTTGALIGYKKCLWL